MNIFRRSPVREITVIEDVNENSLLVKQFKNLDIKIYGSHEEPLFKAKDIGDLLGIKDIKSSIRDFDENMSVIYSIHDTNGVKQEMIMLTEFGLYEVLFTSRKAIANEFKKWVCEIIKEIRLHAKYNLQEQLKINEEQLRVKEEELIKYKSRTYEEIQKTKCVYILSTDKLGIYKCGRTKNSVERRKNDLQTNCVDTIEILFEYKTNNDILLESIIHYVLDRYRTNSNREHFECNLEYMIMIIEYIGKMIDTCKSTFQTISREEFVDKVNSNLSLPLYKIETIDEENNDINSEFVNKYIIKKENSYIIWSELWDKFNYLMYNEHCITVNKKVIKTYFEKKVFKCSENCMTINGFSFRGWKGFKLI
jgi:prophage antirepressor-like protein/uncharacterized protein YnzC (UPF0291/DUF896 family)